jgi:predicted lipid-binding transport protein (Tim44 family)
MMKLVFAITALTTLSFFAVEADAARRLGGGKNLGMQRSAPAQQKAAPNTPPQQQQQQAAPATPAQPQPSGLQKWLGPLAGLALGAGLAALFFNNGMAGLLGGLLVIGLIIAVVVFAARALMRGRTAERPMQYAGFPGTASPPATLPGGAGAHSVAATTVATPAGGLPAGFDAAAFVRHAKSNFVRMQEAHDKKDLSTMRDFLTPGVYREVEADILAAGDMPRQTEVLTLEAEVLDVAEEAGSYIVSVRFSGLIREDAGAAPEPFSEIWHLEKPLAGRSGWLVAGIQQS